MQQLRGLEARGLLKRGEGNPAVSPRAPDVALPLTPLLQARRQLVGWRGLQGPGLNEARIVAADEIQGRAELQIYAQATGLERSVLEVVAHAFMHATQAGLDLGVVVIV